MTLEQLRIFLAVTEHLHFTRASEALFITQPAVSAAIQNLEEEYGVKLFHRLNRRIEITDAGKLLQIEAQKILDQVVMTERRLREFNNLQQGELKLGSSLTIGNYWLPKQISQFKQEYPGISVNCTLANAEEICAGTATGAFDLGVIAGEIKSTLKSVLDQMVVGRDRLLIVVGQSHPWFGQAIVPLTQLGSTPWVMRESGSGAQSMFEQTLKQWGVDLTGLDVALVLNSSEMVKAVVESGVGAAAIPELMVLKELQLSTLHAVRVKDIQTKQILEIEQPVLLLKHRQRYQSQIAIAFEQMVMGA